jgi:formylglycine-generating enzyme required for sulfatase activity
MVADGAFTTTKVDAYNPNDYGLYNMSGNVAEMIWKFKTNTAGTKGGSWYSDVDHVKISAEDEYEGEIDASPFIGFRPVFTAKKSK